MLRISKMEQPEKKKRKKTMKKKSSSPPLPYPSFSLLPYDIVANCLSRLPRSYYPKLSFVSKNFRSVLSSTELYVARARLGNTEECLYVCLWDCNRSEYPQWYTLKINPNRAKKTKKTVNQLLVPIGSSGFPSVSNSVVVGSEMYIIGSDRAPSSAVRVLHGGSHEWRNAPSMNVARKDSFTCVYDGKIYVIGGMRDDDSSFAEVFNTKTQTWECLPDPGAEVRKCPLSRIAEIKGRIHLGYLLKRYAFDPKEYKWEYLENKIPEFPMSECVIDNVSYSYGIDKSRWWCQWSDINGGDIKEVKGLEELETKYMRNGGSSRNTTKLASCSGKLYVMWEGYMRPHRDRKKKIWCAEISLEKRDVGEDREIWGNVEWLDVVHTVLASSELLHCLAVSV